MSSGMVRMQWMFLVWFLWTPNAMATTCVTTYTTDIAPFMDPPTYVWQTYEGDCTGEYGCNDFFELYMPVDSVLALSFCDHGGGASWDTALAGWNSNGGQVVCLDDSCGLRTAITYEAQFAGTYLFRIGAYSGQNGIYTLAYKFEGADADFDGDPDETDCDDEDPDIFTGAEEICDYVDNDCDDITDEDGTEVFYRDRDGDGYGRTIDVTLACWLPNEHSEIDGDCNDLDADVFPGNPEVCDDKDNNCDTVIDEGLDMVWYQDADGDTFGLTNVSTVDCADPGQYWTDAAGDCDDDNSNAFPDNPETCDLIDNNCNGDIDEGQRLTFFRDIDADGFGTSDQIEACELPVGYAVLDGDCDDLDNSVNPDQIEICDLKDNDCNNVIDELVTTTYYQDFDADGVGNPNQTVDACVMPAGYSIDGTDCNDSNSLIHPGQPEVCDQQDNDCNGEIDDGLLMTIYADDDGDGHGDPNDVIFNCELSGGWSMDDTDCDDGDSEVYAGAPEVCDQKDNDCDQLIDAEDPDNSDTITYYLDRDFDGFGDNQYPSTGCEPPAFYVIADGDCDDSDALTNPDATEIAYDDIDQDCNGLDLVDVDGDAHDGGPNGDDCNDSNPLVNPDATESANGIDDDCNGLVDDNTIHDDTDNDGWSEEGGDCDDTNPDIHPAAIEQCDNLDNDCDLIIDEQTECYDDDRDGFCEALDSCTDGSQPGDCHDTDAATYPGAPEVTPNGVDNDCDGIIDSGDPDEDGDGFSEVGGDCDLSNPDIHPAASEIADEIDNDCDGIIDEGTEFYDDDNDGTTEVEGDCDDSNAAVGPDVLETLNGRDDDCDGIVDNGGPSSDDDGDGWSEETGDCNDDDSAIHPSALERENELDDDCDGLVDEDFEDLDRDGFTAADGDCDDENGWVHPEREEVCDNIDNDCDGIIDGECDTAMPSEDPVDAQSSGCSIASSGLTAPMVGGWLIVCGLASRRRRT